MLLLACDIFFMTSLPSFGIKVVVASQNSLGVFLSLQFYGSLRRVDVSPSLNASQNLSLKQFGPGLLLCGRFLITVSIS